MTGVPWHERVQLPFLQVVLGEFSLVPFAVGQATADEVAEVLEHRWDDEATLIVVSSDLSHFHDYWPARHRKEDGTAKHQLRLTQRTCSFLFLPLTGIKRNGGI